MANWKKYTAAFNGAVGGKLFLIPGFVSGCIGVYAFVQNRLDWLPEMSIWALFLLALLPIGLWAIAGLTYKVVCLENDADPNLNIIFENNANYVTPTPLYSEKTRLRGSRAYYVRLKVVNSGVEIALKCVPYLLAIDVETTKGFTPTRYAEGGRLLWSNMPSRDEARSGNNLPKGVPHFFDVAATESLNNALQIQTHPLPARFENLFRFPGNYRFKIKIAGEGAESSIFYLLIRWTGAWNKISAEEWKGT